MASDPEREELELVAKLDATKSKRQICGILSSKGMDIWTIMQAMEMPSRGAVTSAIWDYNRKVKKAGTDARQGR